MSFFRSPEIWKSQGERSGLYGGCWSVSQPNLWTVCLTRWQYGDGRYHAKGWFRPTAFQGVLTLWRVAAPSATKKRTTPLCSTLLASIPSAGRKDFALRSSPCMSPSLQMAVSIRNNSVASLIVFSEKVFLFMFFSRCTPYIARYNAKTLIFTSVGLSSKDLILKKTLRDRRS